MTHQQALETMAAERYLLEEMTEVEKHAFEDHFFDCADCAQDVRLGDRVRGEVRSQAKAAVPENPARGGASGPDSTIVAFPARPGWRKPSVVLPWAAAATLAVAVGYQSLVTIPALSQSASPQSLSPVMLREATRGELPMVVVPRDQRFVAIGLDVIGGSAQDVTYELHGATGNTILSGRSPLPPPGAPLFLLLPADELAGRGRYTLIVRSPGDAGAPLGEYGFNVTN